ncbi:MAG: PQQ-binding-like beta-propeller repeat protein [Planctomycetes bacterium]|nr:PQQ-binding-like beta-propeller repeat protein [Planctomycetota bacterium]
MAFRNLFASSLMLIFTLGALAAEPTWPRYRGPDGNSQSSDKNLPVKWDAKSIVWKKELPGSGQSSPIIWGDRIFLTAALENGKKRVVFCVDRKKGDILWLEVAWTGEPEASHAQNGWATASCATDGERVVAFFGKGGIHCYTMEGKLIWSRDLGTFPGMWGTAASPIIVGDQVIQNCEEAGKGSLVALNKKDGKDVWSTPRTAPERGGWSTPVLVKSGDKTELVLNGEKAVSGYDPLKGTQLWTCKSFAGRGEPTVTPGDGIMYVINGQPGDIYAVKPGGKGDVTKSHMAWHTPRKGGRDQPSPVLVGKYLLVVNMPGLVICYDAETGKQLWDDRIKGPYSSSPIAANGLVYFQNEAGETTVIEPGPAVKIVATNPLDAKGEVFRAALTPCEGQIFARSDKMLYCIGKK